MLYFKFHIQNRKSFSFVPFLLKTNCQKEKEKKKKGKKEKEKKG